MAVFILSDNKVSPFRQVIEAVGIDFYTICGSESSKTQT